MPHGGRNPPNSGESFGEVSVYQYRGTLQLTTGEKRLLFCKAPIEGKRYTPI